MRNRKWALAGVVIVALIGTLAGCGGQTAGDKERAPSANVDRAAAPSSEISRIVTEESSQTPDADVPTGNPVQVSDLAPPEPPLPEIVAKVNDKPITGIEFQRQLDLSTEMMAAQGMPIKFNTEQKRELLEDMVRERVLEDAAVKAGATVTDEEVKALLDKGKRGISEEEFQDYLKKSNIEESQFNELLRSRLIKEKFVEEKTKDVAVTSEEVAAEYETLKAGGRLERGEKSADFAHILIKIDQNADEDAWNKGKEKIDAAKARIAAGEKFEDVAREVSEDPGSADNGGAYMEIANGNMVVPEVDDRLFTMPLNEVSEPFRTQYGWHIMKVTAVHEPGTATFDEVKGLIEKRMKQKKSQELMQAFLEESVKTADIEILYPEGSSKSLTPPEEPRDNLEVNPEETPAPTI